MKFKLLIAACVIPFLAHAEDTQPALDKFWATYGYLNAGEKTFVVTADFDGDSNNELIVCYSKSDFQPESGFYMWVVYQKKNNEWIEVHTIEEDRRKLDFSSIDFWPETAGFVTLPKFEKKGILSKFGKPSTWTFTYMENNFMKSMSIDNPADIDSRDEDLATLCETNKVTFEEKDIPADIAPSE